MPSLANHSIRPLEPNEQDVLLDGLAKYGDATDRVLIFVMLNTGLRKGEMAHLKPGWISWQSEEIGVPNHEPCECGYCNQQAKRMAERWVEGDIGYPDFVSINTEEPPRVLERIHQFDDAKGYCIRARWHPKTGNAVRTIPLKDTETREILRNYLDVHEDIGVGPSQISRRVKSLAERIEDDDSLGSINKKVTPHALRKTFATELASKDFTMAAITSVMGWESEKTAKEYIEFTGRRVHDEFDDKW